MASSEERVIDTQRASRRWEELLADEGYITKKHLFELCRDIMKIRKGSLWRSKDPAELRRDGMSLMLYFEQTANKEAVEVQVLDDNTAEQESWKFLRQVDKRGRERYTVLWATNCVYSPLLRAQFESPEFKFRPVSLNAADSFQLGRRVWGTHLATQQGFVMYTA